MAFLNEHILLPLGDLLQGRQVYRFMHRLAAAERWSDDRMTDFQQKRLRTLLEYSAARVPFYRDWFAATGLNPATVSLQQLPIVDKGLMRTEGIGRFAAEGFNSGQRLSASSSGSTGEPFAFYTSRLSDSVNTAAKLLTWQKAGYSLGDRYIKIANSPRRGAAKRMQDRVNRCLYIPFEKLDRDSLRHILNQIETFQPRFIRSYPSPLFMLARQREADGGYHFSPRHIMTTGATLSAASRKLIEQAFGCDVIDSYSCEGTANTYETPAHDGYHQCRYYGITEVLDREHRPVSNGIGHVVSTDLWNLAHPFIRYDTQDLVEMYDGRVVRIVGRDCDTVLTVNGVTVTSNNLDKYFAHHSAEVCSYRMLRRRDGSLALQLEVAEGYNDDVHAEISGYWSRLLGRHVAVEVVDHQPLLHNNKYLTIIEE